MSTESRLVTRMRKALVAEFGGFWVKTHGGPFQVAGLPDLVGCVQGCFIGIEVKRPEVSGPQDDPCPFIREGATRRQSRILRLIDEAGGFATVSKSVDHALSAVKEFLIS